MTPFKDPAVAAVFKSFPDDVRGGLLQLREQIFSVAKTSESIAPITEALRWGQPAYLSKTGSTLRLGIPKTGGFAIYAHCQTTIIGDFAQMFPEGFKVEGNRAVYFDDVWEIDSDKLHFLISNALTYKA